VNELCVQVGSVSAVDKDSNEFNALSYSFQSADEVAEWFAIDESSGVLTTRQPLDREVKDTRTLTRVLIARCGRGCANVLSLADDSWIVKLKTLAHSSVGHVAVGGVRTSSTAYPTLAKEVCERLESLKVAGPRS